MRTRALIEQAFLLPQMLRLQCAIVDRLDDAGACTQFPLHILLLYCALCLPGLSLVDRGGSRSRLHVCKCDQIAHRTADRGLRCVPLLRRRTLLARGANWRRLIHRYQELLVFALLCDIALSEMFGVVS